MDIMLEIAVIDGILLGIAIVLQRLYVSYIHKKKSREKQAYTEDPTIKLHVISETAWVTQGQGVHTAYLESLELLANDPQVDIVINGKGWGNLLHSHTYGPYYFWKGRKYKGRRILTAHVIPDSSIGTISFGKQLLPFTKAYLKAAYNYADIIIAISPTVKNEIIKLGVSTNIVCIGNPVLTNNWKKIPENRAKGRKLLGLNEDEKMILGVGQLQKRKGVEDFINMAIAMPEYRFVWVGGRPMGTFTEGIRRIDNQISNAPPNISFTGLTDIKDMPAMYAAADLFIFPSYQENCPLAPLEAAAAGLPVIFRDIPEYKLLYHNPYLKAADMPDFIAIAKRLLTDTEFYKNGVNLSANLITEFNQEKIKSDLLYLYRQTLYEYFFEHKYRVIK